MKSFIELFVAARSVSTPLTCIRTADNTSAISAIRTAIGKEAPVVSWNCVTGCTGLNDAGTAELTELLAATGLEQAATAAFPVFLGLLRSMKKRESDLVAFAHNAQLQFNGTADPIQGVLNLRDPFKASGAMLVLLEGSGDELPVELLQHTLILDQPLPTRDELAKVVTDVFTFAAQSKTGKACEGAATPEVIKAAVDAGIGLPMFPFEQAVATSLDKKAGKLDIDTLWHRKRTIVSANKGLTYHPGTETLADMYGCASWVKSGRLLMNGPKQPTVIVRMDEIQRQLAGSNSDSSGTKGNLMGEFLTWVNDRKVICTLNLGVSGTSKSWGPYCIAGEYHKPVINMSIPAMEDMHVGNSTKFQKNAHNVLDAISDGCIWLIASANSLDGLPPELISRFQAGGIYFFDLPDENEKLGILKLKIRAYGIDPAQPMPEMPFWTGRDIDNCCNKATLYGIPLVEAADYIVPLHQSHTQMIEDIRSKASGKYLSASKPGVYQHQNASNELERLGLGEPEVVGRRMR